MSEKTLGADAAAVESAGSIDTPKLTHDDVCARAIHELRELKLDIDCDMGEAIRAKEEPEIAMARLKAYEDVMGLIDVRVSDISAEIGSGTDSQQEQAVPTRRSEAP